MRQRNENNRRILVKLAKEMFDIENTSGIEAFATLHRVAHISEMLEMQLSEGQDLSGPRWRLMLRLMIAEKRGNALGLTPTDLSKSQRVSKNTVSALLRGLEEQGLIQRELDPSDLRVFRIQLTDNGRELMHSTAPRRIERLNDLLNVFSSAEIEQLISLLETLEESMLAQMQQELAGI